MTLREQVAALPHWGVGTQADLVNENAVLALVAERERLLRERIEALPRFERSALLRSNGAWISRRDVLGVFDDES